VSKYLCERERVSLGLYSPGLQPILNPHLFEDPGQNLSFVILGLGMIW
jgi:hypothetical protein